MSEARVRFDTHKKCDSEEDHGSKRAGKDATIVRSSLDVYTRYRGGKQETDLTTGQESASTPLPSGYVLRKGIDGAVAAKPDVPTNEVVAEERRAMESALSPRLPRHLQLLIDLANGQEEEAAQKYYTRDFKESRRELIERLLDPTLTLEDTARILGVVPATVRRYTNRGVLPHHRTVGQQRRFRLSDVLAFLEAHQGHADEESGDALARL